MTDKSLDRIHSVMFYGLMIGMSVTAIGWLWVTCGWQAGMLGFLAAWTLAVAAAALFWGTAHSLGRRAGICETLHAVKGSYDTNTNTNTTKGNEDVQITP